MAKANKTNSAANVSTGKPKSVGAVFAAPIGEALPTNATDALSEQFVCLGYVSEDGLTNGVEMDNEDFTEWGGEVVLTSLTSRKETFSLTFIESNIDVLKLVYGAENVTGDFESGLKVAHKASAPEKRVFVFELVLNNGRIKRIVVPCGQVAEVSDISYKAKELIGYEMTIAAVPDENGATAYEHFAKAV